MYIQRSNFLEFFSFLALLPTLFQVVASHEIHVIGMPHKNLCKKKALKHYLLLPFSVVLVSSLVLSTAHQTSLQDEVFNKTTNCNSQSHDQYQNGSYISLNLRHDIRQFHYSLEIIPSQNGTILGGTMVLGTESWIPLFP